MLTDMPYKVDPPHLLDFHFSRLPVPDPEFHLFQHHALLHDESAKDPRRLLLLLPDLVSDTWSSHSPITLAHRFALDSS